MLNSALLIILGMFLGWNFPQPGYAKLLQQWVKAKWFSFRNGPVQ